MFDLAKKVVVIIATVVSTGGVGYLGHSVISSYVNSIVAANAAVDEASDPPSAKPSAKRSVTLDLSGLFR